MKFTTTLLLTALVGALAFFVVRYESRQPDTKQSLEAKARPFTFNPKLVDTILIAGKDVELKLVRSDNQWRAVYPFKDRANAELISKVVTAISELEWTETIKRKDIKSSDWKRAGLNDASLELALLAKGKELARLKLGAAGVLEGSIFISTVDSKSEQMIHLAKTTLGTLATRPADGWRDSRLLRLAPESVTRFVISAGDGVLEFSRKPGQGWELTKPLQARASQERVNAVLNALLNLEAKAGKTPPNVATTASVPVMKVTLTASHLEKPVELTLQPSEKPEDEPLVSVSDRPGLFAVPPKVATFWKLQPNHLRDQHLVHIDGQKATALRIRSVANPEIVLNRDADTWMLTRHGVSSAANQERVRKLFEGLNNALVVDFAADAPKSLDAFGLTQPFLEIEWSQTDAPQTLQFGKGKDEGIFARLGAEPFVYRINPAMLGVVPPDSLKWRDPTVLNLNIFSIKRIIVSAGLTPPSTLHYDPSYGSWKAEIAGKDATSNIDRAKADALLQMLVNLQAAEWTTERTAAYASLKNPALTIQLLTVDPLDPSAPPKPLNISFAPTVANMDTAVYHGRINEDPDTFLISRELFRQLAAPVVKSD